MKSKKYLIKLIAILMILSLTACSKPDEEPIIETTTEPESSTIDIEEIYPTEIYENSLPTADELFDSMKNCELNLEFVCSYNENNAERINRIRITTWDNITYINNNSEEKYITKDNDYTVYVNDNQWKIDTDYNKEEIITKDNILNILNYLQPGEVVYSDKRFIMQDIVDTGLTEKIISKPYQATYTLITDSRKEFSSLSLTVYDYTENYIIFTITRNDTQLFLPDLSDSSAEPITLKYSEPDIVLNMDQFILSSATANFYENQPIHFSRRNKGYYNVSEPGYVIYSDIENTDVDISYNTITYYSATKIPLSDIETAKENFANFMDKDKSEIALIDEILYIEENKNNNRHIVAIQPVGYMSYILIDIYTTDTDTDTLTIVSDNAIENQ